MVRIRVVRYVVHLLGFLPHETMRRWYLTKVKPWKILLGHHVLLRHLQVRLEVVNQPLIVHALHVLIWIELIFELAVEFRIGLVDHVSEILSIERLPFIWPHLRIQYLLIYLRPVLRVVAIRID